MPISNVGLTPKFSLYVYDPYGAVTMYDGPAVAGVDWSDPHTVSSVGNTLLYASMVLDPATGLYYDEARWYSTAVSTFISRDPAVSTSNLYCYCGDEATDRTDPSGLASTSPSAPGQGPGPLSWGGEVIGGPGCILVPSYPEVFSSDTAPPGGWRPSTRLSRWGITWQFYFRSDMETLKYELPMGTLHTASSWQDIHGPLSMCGNHTVDALVISGHGSVAGGVSSSGGLDADAFKPNDANIINQKLKSGAPIIFLGCGDKGEPGEQSESEGAGLAKIASMTGHPVIQNTRHVTGTYGKGCWLRYPAPVAGAK